MLRVSSTGTAAAGLGAGLLFSLETATASTMQNAAQIAAVWVDATNATRGAKLRLSAFDTSIRTGIEIEASGTAAMIGFLGATPIVRPVNTVAIDTLLVNLGLRATGGTANFATDIEGKADAYFTGAGTGLPYGGVYGENVAYDLVMAAQDTDYQILGFATAADNNLVTVSVANSDLTITKTGVYLVGWNAAAHSHAANDYSIFIKINNGATAKVNTKAHFDSTVGDKLFHVGNSAICSFTANDTVELWAHRNDGLAVSKTITFDHVNMHVTMIGG